MSVIDCVGYDSSTIEIDLSPTCKITNVDASQSPYTTLLTDEFILVNASAGNVIINLAATTQAVKYTFKRTDSTTNTITINPPIGKTVDGVASYSLPRETEVVTFCHCVSCNDYKVVSDKLDRTLTTKGDLFVHNGTKVIRVGVGVNNQVLTADSTTASGVAWKPEGGTDGSNYQLFSGTAVPTSPTFTPIAYFPWDNAFHNSFTSGTLVVRVNASVNRGLNIRINDVTSSVVRAVLNNITVTGTYAISFTTFPTIDSELRLEISKTSQGGINPRIFGCVLEFT